MAKKEKIKRTPLERSIISRERGIAQMEESVRRLERQTAEEVKVIRNRIAEKRILLDALKRGAIKS